jgi:hypothetical protein
MHPHGGAPYVRRAKQTRIDPHRGEIKRLAGRTVGLGVVGKLCPEIVDPGRGVNLILA